MRLEIASKVPWIGRWSLNACDLLFSAYVCLMYCKDSLIGGGCLLWYGLLVRLSKEIERAYERVGLMESR